MALSSDLKKRWLGNASSNLLGGMLATAYNLALPAILSRYLSISDFSIWNLAMQVTVYLYVFNGGIQTAVNRFIAAAYERQDLEDQMHTIGAAKIVAAVCSVLSILFTIILVWIYPLVIDGLNEESIDRFQVCILWIGLTTSIQTLSLVSAGAFFGRHQNIVWLKSQTIIRLLTLGGVYWLTKCDADILVIVKWFSFFGVLLVPLSELMCRRYMVDIPLLPGTTKTRIYDISKYCSNLMLWGVAMLMVNGMAVAIVGYFELSKVSPYSLAFSLTNTLNGLLVSILSPMMTNFAALNAIDGTSERLKKILTKSTRITAVLLLIGILLTIFVGKQFLIFWVGSQYAMEVYPLLIFMILSLAIRNLCLPYSYVMLAVGNPKNANFSILFEGICSVVGSVYFSSKYGAIGVAFGSVLASSIGLLTNTFILYPKNDYFGGVIRYVMREIIPYFIVMSSVTVVCCWIFL